VKLMAVAYAWSQKGMSYFLSTCGSTRASPVQYMSRFEDEFGNSSFKYLNRPEFVHFLYEKLPIIDEHNRQRQGFVALEKCWPTTNCWFRLLTTIVGMSIVDMHRMQRFHNTGKNVCKNTLDEERDSMTTIIHFCNQISGGVRKRPDRSSVVRHSIRTTNVTNSEVWWERITGRDGSIYGNLTTRQIRKHGRTVGTSIQQHCWVCRKYIGLDGKPLYSKTSFRCKDCKRPICINEDRSMPGFGRPMSCKDEHKLGVCPAVSCIGRDDPNKERKFPYYYQFRLNDGSGRDKWPNEVDDSSNSEAANDEEEADDSPGNRMETSAKESDNDEDNQSDNYSSTSSGPVTTDPVTTRAKARQLAKESTWNLRKRKSPK